MSAIYDPEAEATRSLRAEAREEWVAERAAEIAADPKAFAEAAGWATDDQISRLDEIVRKLAHPEAGPYDFFTEAARLVSEITIAAADSEYEAMQLEARESFWRGDDV